MKYFKSLFTLVMLMFGVAFVPTSKAGYGGGHDPTVETKKDYCDVVFQITCMDVITAVNPTPASEIYFDTSGPDQGTAPAKETARCRRDLDSVNYWYNIKASYSISELQIKCPEMEAGYRCVKPPATE